MLPEMLVENTATQQQNAAQPLVHQRRTRGVLLLLAGLLLASYFPMLRTTAQFILFSDDMAHGFVAPLVAMGLVWSQRDALLRPTAAPSFWALPMLGLAASIGVVAVLANSTTFSRFAFLISLAGCLLLIGGRPALRQFVFPLSLLLFTFPLPDVLYGAVTQPLQLLATYLSESLLDGLGFSVVRDGNILQLPHLRLSVVEACSGLRSLISLFFLCLVYAYLFEERLWLRWVIALLSIPAAILINTLRITATGVLGSDNPVWMSGIHHEFLGWAGFCVGVFLVLAVHHIIRRLVRPIRQGVAR
jgi:exosortase